MASPYARFYAAWHNSPTADTPITASFLDTLEDEIVRLSAIVGTRGPASQDGIILGGDTNWYRSAANTMKTDDTVIAVGGNSLGFRYNPSSAAGSGFGTLVQGESFGRFDITYDGIISWGPGSGGVDTTFYRAAADTLKSDDGFWAVGGLVTKTKAGVPSDSDLVAGLQQSGAMILDTTNSRMYFRVGSTWKYAALT